MSDAIRAEALTKYYGAVVGIEDLDLAVAPGEVYGFLGPNGAGKTTTIRILLAPPGVSVPLTSRLIWVALNLLAVVWCFGAASLALATHARRRAVAAGVTGLAMVFLYLLQFAAAAWAPARPLARISPFHYYEGMRTLLGLNDARPDIITLLVAAALMVGWAYVAYARRDL